MDDNRPANDDGDASLVWRWAARATAPAVGWMLVAAGVVAIMVGWAGASREEFPAQQIPYLISGGLLGVALVFFGGVFLSLQDVRRLGERLGRLESQVGDIHAALLRRPDAPAPSGASLASPDWVVVLEGGASFHRPECAVVADKDGTTSMELEEATARALSPCKLCAPVVMLSSGI